MIAESLTRRALATYVSERLRALIQYGHIINDHQLEVLDAGEKGKGLFTTINRLKGSVVFVAPGPVRLAHFAGSDCYLYPDWYGVDKDTWVEIIDPYVRANHSCEPNLGLDGRRVFVARRYIAAGEELTYDYSVTDDELDWVMEKPCSCGASTCRKRIGPIQSLNQSQFEEIYPFIPKHMRQVFYSHQQAIHKQDQ